MIGSLSSRVPKEHKQYFEEGNGGALKCLPCTWQAQKQGSREELLIMLDKKEKIDLHLGLKVRKSKSRRIMRCSWSGGKGSRRCDTAMCIPLALWCRACGQAHRVLLAHCQQNVKLASNAAP